MPAMTKYHRLGGFHNKILFHTSGLQKSKIRVLTGLVSPESLLGFQMSSILVSLKMVILLWMYTLGVSFSYKNTSPLGFEPTHVTSFAPFSSLKALF